MILQKVLDSRPAGELGRLQISSMDGYKRVTALTSVHLLLQSLGQSQVTPHGELRDLVQLDEPRSGAFVSGGEVTLAGLMQPANKMPVFIELVATDGHVINSRVLTLAPPDATYQAFETTLPYQVTSRTPALLVIRKSDERISGPFYFYSQPIVLSP